MLDLGFYLEKLQRSTAFKTLPEDHVFAYLTRLSDGEIDMAVDGSVVTQNFDYVVPAGTIYKKLLVTRINMVMGDASIRYDRFLGFAAALPNGILFQVIHEDGTILQHFGTDIKPMNVSGDFAALAGVDVVAVSAGSDLLPVRWTIAKSGNKMTMYPNWTFRCVVQDDLTPATGIRMMLQGVLR